MATLTIEIDVHLTDASVLPITFETGEISVGSMPLAAARDTALLNTATGTWPQALPLGSVAAPGLCMLKHCTSGGSDIEVGYTKDGAAFSAAYPRTLDFESGSVAENDVIDVYFGEDKVATYTVLADDDLEDDVLASITSQLDALQNCSAAQVGTLVTLTGVGTLEVTVEKNTSAWSDVEVNTPIEAYADEWVPLQTLQVGKVLILNLEDFPETPQWKPQSSGENLVSYLLLTATT